MAMPNESDGYLYRLLRDEEEDPLSDGIMAKDRSDVSEPVYHIRYGSCPNVKTKWISTCASLEALNKFIELKKKKSPHELCLRYVKIDLTELRIYAQKCTLSITYEDELAEVINDRIFSYVPLIDKTGRILDFTDKYVVDQYLPERPEGNIPRNYVAKYEEVLVERFIPAHCCKVLHSLEYNQTREKTYCFLSEIDSEPQLQPQNVRQDPTTYPQTMQPSMNCATVYGSTVMSSYPPFKPQMQLHPMPNAALYTSTTNPPTLQPSMNCTTVYGSTVMPSYSPSMPQMQQHTMPNAALYTSIIGPFY